MDVSLDIIDIGANGDGIARLPDGRTVFVPFSTGGDKVQARLEEGADKALRASILSLEQGGPDRAIPPCRHFGICGGCSLQHLSEVSYQSFKRGQVEQILSRAGVSVPEAFNAVFLPAGIRRRANFAAVTVKGRTTIGFHERRSGNIRNVPDCLLLDENLRAAMEAMRPFIPRLTDEGRKIDLLIQCIDGQVEIGLTGRLGRKAQSPLDLQETLGEIMRGLNLCRLSLRERDYAPYETLLEERPFLKRFGRLSVNLSPGAFLQPNLAGEETLTRLVMDAVESGSPVADLFCGNGTFTGPLMENGPVFAADFAPDAIASLRRAGADAVVRNLFKDPLQPIELKRFNVVVLDPPRAGASAQVECLAASDVSRLVYVSCSPQSFAKDAARLVAGGYGLSALTLVDQFTWSVHSELVAVFDRR